MDDRLFTIVQTARQFNLTTGLLYAAVARGELAAIRLRPRGGIRVSETDARSRASGIEPFLPPEGLRRFAGYALE